MELLFGEQFGSTFLESVMQGPQLKEFRGSEVVYLTYQKSSSPNSLVSEKDSAGLILFPLLLPLFL